MARNSTKSHQTDDIVQPPSGILQKAAGGGGIAISAQLLIFLITIASGIWLARLLSPEDFGLLGLTMSVIGFATVLQEMGLSSATIQKREISYSQASNLFWINVSLGATLTVTIFIFSGPIGSIFSDNRITELVAALSPIFLIDSLGVQHRALMQRSMKFRTLALIDCSAIVVYSAVTISLAQMLGTYWALAIGLIVKSSTRTVLLASVFKWLPSIPRGNTDIQDMLAFGMHVAGSDLLAYISRNLDNILIGGTWGSTALGYYAKAYQLFVLPISQLISPLRPIATSLLSRVYHNDKIKYSKIYQGLVGCLLIVLSGPVIIIGLNAEYLIGLVIGTKWLPAAPILLALTISSLFQPLSVSMGWLLVSQGRSRELLRWGLISSSLTSAAFFIGLPWGALGVALSYSLSGVFVRLPLIIWFVGRRGPVPALRLLTLALLPICIASIVTVFHIVAKTILDLNDVELLIWATILAIISSVLILFVSVESKLFARTIISYFKNSFSQKIIRYVR